MNAIILASGLGSRLRPYTNTTPKPLLEVKGLPIIEHTIRHLIDAGIDDITIVVGYKKEQFKYLSIKYEEVRLIENSKYDIYNNWYSLYLAYDKLKEDTFVIDGDLFIRTNIFKDTPKTNFYYVSDRGDNYNEWELLLDSDDRVIDYKLVEHNKSCLVHSSASHWMIDGCQEVRRVLSKVVSDSNRHDSVWDHYMIRLFENIDIYTREISTDDAIELDTVTEYEEVNA